MSDYPEILQDLADKAAVFLVEEGLEKDRAQAISKKLAEYVRTEWGGQNQYIPKGISYECTQRHYEIFEKFRGDNYTQLAREYDLTEMRIRQIINAVRAVEMSKRQGGLF
jgi:Mor family transcriptional regulator